MKTGVEQVLVRELERTCGLSRPLARSILTSDRARRAGRGGSRMADPVPDGALAMGEPGGGTSARSGEHSISNIILRDPFPTQIASGILTGRKSGVARARQLLRVRCTVARPTMRTSHRACQLPPLRRAPTGGGHARVARARQHSALTHATPHQTLRPPTCVRRAPGYATLAAARWTSLAESGGPFERAQRQRDEPRV